MSSESQPLNTGEKPQVYSQPIPAPHGMALNNSPPVSYPPPNQYYPTHPAPYPQYQVPPPAPASYPQYQAPPPNYYMAHEIVPAAPTFNRKEQNISCWYCNRVVQTRIEHKAGTGTWLGCILICLCGGYIGCCLIPFCVHRCQDVYHYCNNCNSRLGINTAL